jgi:hypothetical protein
MPTKRSVPVLIATAMAAAAIMAGAVVSTPGVYHDIDTPTTQSFSEFTSLTDTAGFSTDVYHDI